MLCRGLMATIRSFVAFLQHLMPNALVANTMWRVSFGGMRGTRFVPQTAQWAQLDEHLDHWPSYCSLRKSSVQPKP